MRLRFLRALTLKQRVFGFMGLLGLIPIACLGIIVYETQQAQTAEGTAKLASKGAVRLARIDAAIYAIVMESRGIYMSRSIAEVEQYVKGLEKQIQRLNVITLEWQKEALPSEAEKVKDLGVAISNLVRIRQQVLQLGKLGEFSRAQEVGTNDDSRGARKALNASVESLTKLYEAHERRAQIQREELSSMSLTLIMAMVALTLLLGGLGLYTVHRTVILLFNRMRVVMMELASGNLNVNFHGVDRSDEIGDFARAFQAFKNDASQKQIMIRDAETQRALLDEERQKAARTQAARAAELETAIRALKDSLHRLSNGDLTVRIAEDLAPDFADVKTDFNETASKLQSTLLLVSENSGAISRGSREILAASDDLSKRTEQQASSLEETAAALDQITATVKKTAEGAANAQEIAASAKTNAERAAEIVRSAVAAVGGIERSSNEIGKIIGVIDEIAFQTNLLALNAGVEAARAGDAGRGFAVVASEVRGLAQRSAQAAKEIKSLIQASGKHVQEGVTLVGQTGDSLGLMLEQVQKISLVVTEIASGAREQAQGMSEVNSAVNQMDQVTQQNAAMVEQTTASSHTLAETADQLDELMRAFRLDNNHRQKRAA